jgi:hypothetical protein
MHGMITSLVLVASLSYIVINEGDLKVTTPGGMVIIIPEGSEFETNRLRVHLDGKVVTLDNVLIFRDSYEST